MRAMIVFLFAWLVVQPCMAFDGHRVSREPLTLVIEEFNPPAGLEEPVEVPFWIENSGGRDIECRVEVHGLVDEWRPVGKKMITVTVPAGGEARDRFSISAGAGVERALYPVHLTARARHDGGELELHAVRIFESKIPRGDESAAGPLELVDGGMFDLADPAFSEVVWRGFDGGEGRRPRGWAGSDEATGTNRQVQSIDRGGLRRSIVMHPPYRGVTGTVSSVFQVRLPMETPLVLDFANAVRDPDPGALGDGVTFRVRIDGGVVFDRHSNSHTWVEGRADLDHWAGKTITLELESDPGPERNTAFDSSYLGAPAIRSGSEPRVATAEEQATVEARTRKLLDAGRGEGIIVLGGDAKAALVAGPNGWIDGAIGFAMDGKTVQFKGIDLEIGPCLTSRPRQGLSPRRDASSSTSGAVATSRRRS